ncbi:MAG: hypothetical protein AAFX78_13765 [Cyanobacteria bacterium J06638_20]
MGIREPTKLEAIDQELMYERQRGVECLESDIGSSLRYPTTVMWLT